MKILKHWVLRTAFWILGATALVGPLAATNPANAQAADAAPTVMIVLDGSGSMWGKLGTGEKTKFGLSQSLLIEALSAPNPKVNLGFASFGHRRAGNCSDAQVIVPPGPANAETLIQRISKLNPRGKGPLSLTLRQTAASVDPSRASSVVLIHDGYDNCRQDPCKAAEEIATSHPRLVIHLISLDLPASTATAMSCVSQKTNGTAYVVRGEAEFKSAVQSAMALAMLQPPKIAERLTDRTTQHEGGQKASETGPSRLRLVAGYKADAGQRIRNVTWRIASPSSPQNALIEKRTTELAEPIPPGRYIVYAKAGLAETEQQITVGERGETRLRILFDAGMITFNHPNPHQQIKDGADLVFLSLWRKTDGTPRNDTRPLWIGAVKNSDQLIVPNGDFELDVERGAAKKTVGVTVRPGKATAVDTSMNDGLLILDSAIGEAPASEAPPPIAATRSDFEAVAYVVSTDDPSTPGGRREVGRSASPHAKFLLQPGTFYAEARLGQARRMRRFAIGGGQIVRHQFRFDVARVRLEVRLGSQPLAETIPVTFKAYSIGSGPQGTRQRIASTSKRAPNLILPTGRYRFIAEVAGNVRGQSADVEIQSSDPLKFSIPLNAGQVSFKTRGNTGRTGRPRYQIRNAAGDIVWRGRPGQKTSTLLTPGRYVLETRSNPSQTQNIDVNVGGTTVVDLDAAL